MRPEQQIQQVPRRINYADQRMGEVAKLDRIAAHLMAVQRAWNDPSREHRLIAALAEGALELPPEVQHNLLIISVYADSKISECELSPCADTLGSLIALTHTLAGSLREWREAA